MARRSGSLNLNGILETCRRFGTGAAGVGVAAAEEEEEATLGLGALALGLDGEFWVDEEPFSWLPPELVVAFESRLVESISTWVSLFTDVAEPHSVGVSDWLVMADDDERDGDEDGAAVLVTGIAAAAAAAATAASLANNSSSLLNWLYCWAVVFISRLLEDDKAGCCCCCASELDVMIESDLTRGCETRGGGDDVEWLPDSETAAADKDAVSEVLAVPGLVVAALISDDALDSLEELTSATTTARSQRGLSDMSIK